MGSASKRQTRVGAGDAVPWHKVEKGGRRGSWLRFRDPLVEGKMAGVTGDIGAVLRDNKFLFLATYDANEVYEVSGQGLRRLGDAKVEELTGAVDQQLQRAEDAQTSAHKAEDEIVRKRYCEVGPYLFPVEACGPSAGAAR